MSGSPANDAARAGHVTDLPYTAGFYREMAPAHLAFAALAVGQRPDRAWHPRRMLELGCGQGFGLALLAGANPDVAFEGCDLNPEHVTNARSLAEEAQLANLSVTCASFEQLVDRGESDVDVIALHGVLSWVSSAAQEAIVSIIRRRLVPGGFVYVSYNCLPGWAPLSPIRNLIADTKRSMPGKSEAQLSASLDMLRELRHGHARYFAANPSAARHFDEMVGKDPRYLAHEYLNEHWRPLGFSEVASRFAEAGLSYVASATLAENLDQCAVPPAVRPLIARTKDRVLQESLRDFAANKQFRRDIFVRGATPLGAAERAEVLSRLSFVLVVPRERVSFRFPSPLGELTGRDDIYAPLVDALVERARSFDELSCVPPFAGQPEVLMESITLLVHSGQVFPLLAPEPADVGPAQRLNRIIVARARAGEVHDSLACPVTRTGVAVTDFGLLSLAALFDGKGDGAESAAAHGLSIIEALGQRPREHGQPLHGEEAERFLARYMAPIMAESVPIWRWLKMI